MKKGFKVVNYDKWLSLPDIFSNVKEARQAREKWKFGEGAVIESFNPKSSKAKIIL